MADRDVVLDRLERSARRSRLVACGLGCALVGIVAVGFAAPSGEAATGIGNAAPASGVGSFRDGGVDGAGAPEGGFVVVQGQDGFWHVIYDTKRVVNRFATTKIDVRVGNR